MQTWKCMVKMPSNFIQNVEVDANTYNDAVSIAESSTGGKCLNATAQWKSNDNSQSFDFNPSGSSGVGLLILFVLIFVLYAWKWILLFASISFLVWIILRSIRE